METFIIIGGVILSITGIGVAIWSIINTRERYYKDYIRKKKHGKH